MRKKLITMGLVSALGASTSAWAIDLDLATDTPDIFAADSVVAGDLTTEGNTNYTGITVIDGASKLGVGVATGNQVFVRFELTNAVFSGAVTGGLVVSGEQSNSVAQGGADVGTFVIYDVTSAGITQNSSVAWAPAVAIGSGSASVSMAVYETLTQAVNEDSALYTASKVFAGSGAGVSVTPTAATATAEVSEDFKLFNVAGVTGVNGTLGTVLYTISPTATTTAGAGLADGDSITAVGSTVVLNGDVSFGDWYLDATACTGVAGAEVDLVENTTTNLTAAPAVASIAGLTAAHIVCVEVDGTEVVNEGDYTVTFDWLTPAAAVAPIADTTVAVGSTARNGTTVQIPYLTTFADYNQRLVVVNRGASDAEYNITFTTEDGTTATAGSAASGTLVAGEVLSLRASDIVTLAGKTRTAATLTVVATSTTIDVATNQVNLSDGSTDTVVLN